MSPPHRQNARPADESDEMTSLGSPEMTAGLFRNGGGLKLSWPALGCLLTFTAFLLHLQWTVSEHTEALTELKDGQHSFAVKIDALLIDRGLNPHQVVKDAAGK